MFVVGVGSVLTTVLFFKDLGSSSTDQNVFTVPGRPVPVVHRAVRELRRGDRRGPRQGPGRHPAQDPLGDGRPQAAARTARSRSARAPTSTSATSVVVTAGEVIPSDGEVIQGIASVDESAITGESAPVIRESGGDRSAVTGGTRVLSDEIVVRITARPGETFIDRMIALVEGSSRQKTPNEIALNILLAGLTIIFLLATVSLQPFAMFANAEQPRRDPRRAAGVPDPDDDRRAALRDRYRGDGPSRPPQRARDERAGPWKRPVTAPRCCSTRRARSPSGTARPTRSCR